MSKAVKKVGRAIGNVVKGVVNVVKSVAKGVGSVVKKIAKSKIGKALLVAATVYFGGAAIMGAMGGASAGTGFMGTLSGAVSGAGTGIANAWTGLTGAASSALGGNFSAAGSQLSAGFQGTTVAAQNAANITAGGGGGFVNGNYGSVGTNTAANTATGASKVAETVAKTAVKEVGKDAVEKGLISRTWDGLGEYGKMAAVQGASQLAGNVIQGVGQQKALEEQQRYEQEQAQLARDRYNQNAGAKLWGATPEDTTGGAYAMTAQQSYDPAAEARMMAQRYSGMANMPYGGQQVGMIGSRLPASAPMANNNFPVYNPYYYRG